MKIQIFAFLSIINIEFLDSNIHSFLCVFSFNFGSFQFSQNAFMYKTVHIHSVYVTITVHTYNTSFLDAMTKGCYL